jgi:hypothetical protein
MVIKTQTMDTNITRNKILLAHLNLFQQIAGSGLENLFGVHLLF